MVAKPTLDKPVRPTALARAEHGEPPVPLTREETKRLHELLRQVEDTRLEVEASLTARGRSILSTAFEGNAAAALDERTQNPVWTELVRRAGGPTVRISRRALYVALRIAAFDQRIVDQSWRGLDAGRKEILLPLAKDDQLREGARIVSQFNLTQTDTRQYVTEVLKQSGKSRQVRLSVPQVAQRVKKLRSTLGTAAMLKKLVDLRDDTDSQARDAAIAEIDKLRSVLDDVKKAIKGRR